MIEFHALFRSPECIASPKGPRRRLCRATAPSRLCHRRALYALLSELIPEAIRSWLRLGQLEPILRRILLHLLAKPKDILEHALVLLAELKRGARLLPAHLSLVIGELPEIVPADGRIADRHPTAGGFLSSCLLHLGELGRHDGLIVLLEGRLLPRHQELSTAHRTLKARRRLSLKSA